MTVNPAAGVFANSPTTFDPDARYHFEIDQNGDAKSDLTFSIKFSGANNDGRQDGRQNVQLKMGNKAIANGKTGQDISVRGGGLVYAGLFDDPFFFDLVAFQNGLAFCPTDPAPDFFAGLNVTAIVLEVPSAWLGPNNIGVWARTERGGHQIDRMGRPAINTVFIPSNQKDAFNAGQPSNDPAEFSDELIATLLALGNDQATAEALTAVLLPDILTIDTSNPAGFLNGRGLADDVIDAELGLISGGAITSDCVDANDKAFSTTFPYLAAPHS
jgi:hypothetical protein